MLNEVKHLNKRSEASQQTKWSISTNKVKHLNRFFAGAQTLCLNDEPSMLYAINNDLH